MKLDEILLTEKIRPWATDTDCGRIPEPGPWKRMYRKNPVTGERMKVPKCLKDESPAAAPKPKPKAVYYGRPGEKRPTAAKGKSKKGNYSEPMQTLKGEGDEPKQSLKNIPNAKQNTIKNW